MNQDIINNQEQVYIHFNLSNDEAYKYSIENNDPVNMQMVLRANGEAHTLTAAVKQIEVAKTL